MSMIIKKIVNNNVVLSIMNNGLEAIYTGKGIGFQKKIGDEIKENQIEKTFIIEHKEISEKFKILLEHIPVEYISVSYDIIEYTKGKLNTALNDYIYITLTDHLNFAIDRHRKGISYSNSLAWEIKKFYPNEYEVGLKALDIIQEQIGLRLDIDEAANIALHLINASLNSKNKIDETIQMTKATQDILNIVKYSFGIEIDENSLSYERFITHLRFFFQRISRGVQVDGKDEFLYDEITKQYGDSFRCALKVEEYLKSLYNRGLTKEERTYLTVHIERIR